MSNGSLSTTRTDSFTCNLFTTGNTMIVGGQPFFTSWEIRNSSGGAVSTGTLTINRYDHKADVQTTGNLFITGGAGSPTTWEIRSNTGALLSTGTLNANRSGGHAQTQY
ncbi:MAG: hypothetical protein A4E19_13015 [Nitrospira sp. SG-bin1]|nr:MAG: hypothetical protein A4E19_13015 [Nitrospira sp. SG-bin1]